MISLYNLLIYIIIDMSKKTRKIISLDISNKNIKGILNLSDYPHLKYLDCSHNKITRIICVPDSLIKINCSHNKITIIDFEIMNRENIKYIDCSHNPITNLFYNFDIKPNKYPVNLKKIYFGENFNQPLDNLPFGITDIIFPDSEFCIVKFNQQVNLLPDTVKNIYFGCEFNQPLDSLPPGLEKIIFYRFSKFNQPIDLLPSGLKYLYLGNDFSQSVDNLPNGLLHLFLGRSPFFSASIDNLPDSIEELTLNDNYSTPINKLPSSLKLLMIRKSYKYINKIMELWIKSNFSFVISHDYSTDL